MHSCMNTKRIEGSVDGDNAYRHRTPPRAALQQVEDDSCNMTQMMVTNSIQLH